MTPKYYVVERTARLGYSTRTHALTSINGPYGYQKATKIAKIWAEERGEKRTFDENGNLETISRWERMNENQLAFITNNKDSK